MTTTQREISITLTCQADWDEWIEVIQTIATGYGIWDYVDPSKPDLIALAEPVRPTPNDVRPSSTRGGPTAFSSLTPDEVEEYRNLQAEYQRKIKLFDRQTNGLSELRGYIQRTVVKNNQIYTFNCATPWHMLVNLRKRFAPTTETREREVILRYTELRDNPPKVIDTEAWLSKWEKAYTDGRKLNLPDTSGDRALKDFLAVIAT
jgi:hypothetical protein